MREILFADDDPGMRSMVGDTLRAAGFSVRLASSGQEALEAVRHSPPDLAVLDYRMGRPDGFTVCREIKSDPRLEHIPVLILTAQGEVENRVLGFEAGADDYLPKPFDPRELLARCRALLRLARQGLERNPTTALPGSDALSREFDRRLALGEPFSLCYFDLDYFKPFHDCFGYSTADALIRATGRALGEAAAGVGGFAGHIGGDDFVLFAAPERVQAAVREVSAGVAAELEAQLPPEVISAGRYRSRSREGEAREFPLTRLSVAVVRVDPARVRSMEQLSPAIVETKRRAKESPDGLAAADGAEPSPLQPNEGDR